MNELTAVTGVMRGTFTQPMPYGRGGFISGAGPRRPPPRSRFVGRAEHCPGGAWGDT